ncbi:hypothetical protein IGI04_008574 [Brassica rapa subsp. trilocularis]|uniref:Embryo surrounding factor 1 brassicaceae domain-containing protein n=1 Tax=Brassica rapa subsp. trilocularis TaxID=1813537 RepID=A0ABQ7NQ97_BRACM|nr:hypothetical protein IGI04_008574 [Brassica rapa subsp. trilocularis]
MKIQTSLMCIFIISLFTLHQCARIYIREMDKSNIIIDSNCYHTNWFNKRGWCCTALKGDPCWGDKASCDSTCPRPLSSSP